LFSQVWDIVSYPFKHSENYGGKRIEHWWENTVKRRFLRISRRSRRLELNDKHDEFHKKSDSIVTLPELELGQLSIAFLPRQKTAEIVTGEKGYTQVRTEEMETEHEKAKLSQV